MVHETETLNFLFCLILIDLNSNMCLVAAILDNIFLRNTVLLPSERTSGLPSHPRGTPGPPALGHTPEPGPEVSRSWENLGVQELTLGSSHSGSSRVSCFQAAANPVPGDPSVRCTCLRPRTLKGAHWFPSPKK